MKHWVMDYETLINCFVAVFQHYKTEETKVFVVHKLRNDYIQKAKDNGYLFLSWNMIANGYLHMLAIRNDGTLWAWGRNTTVFGQN